MGNACDSPAQYKTAKGEDAQMDEKERSQYFCCAPQFNAPIPLLWFVNSRWNEKRIVFGKFRIG